MKTIYINLFYSNLKYKYKSLQLQKTVNCLETDTNFLTWNSLSFSTENFPKMYDHINGMYKAFMNITERKNVFPSHLNEE